MSKEKTIFVRMRDTSSSFYDTTTGISFAGKKVFEVGEHASVLDAIRKGVLQKFSDEDGKKAFDEYEAHMKAIKKAEKAAIEAGQPTNVIVPEFKTSDTGNTGGSSDEGGEDEDAELKKMTVPELTKALEDLEIEIPAGSKKADLIKLLKEAKADTGNTGGSSDEEK